MILYDLIGAFIEEAPVGFPVLVDAGLRLADWDIAAPPATALIGPEGRPVTRLLGCESGIPQKRWSSSPACCRERMSRPAYSPASANTPNTPASASTGRGNVT